MARLLAFRGKAGTVPDERAGFVRAIRKALTLRGTEVTAEDAFSASSAYSATAGWPWVRVPEDTYELLMRIRLYLRVPAD
ncbi:hypothetical protein [Cereibacter azotoformans]|uniref:Uncharacterized protein n=1 Tax=Cereibacter azotoformans TaxID=43057 RepID=A0A2T5JSZ9_9RHOB|nr:hypothetical protein [Cereibacter azotoformans]PTR12536.1 hypothetical protein C8J28_12436 [Cereibacter azotoformans]